MWSVRAHARLPQMLRSLGCDIGQGYGISRPLAPPMLATWLATTHYRVLRRDSLLPT